MKWVKKIIKFSFLMLLLFIGFHFGLYIYCKITPKVEINKAQSYYLYDANESLIFDDNDDWISLDNISPYLIEATLATEDKYFYKHIGFDYLRIGKAMINNIITRSKSEGASTITQQYARNLFLNFDKTWKRKIDEAILAFELETHYTKDEILEGYLNTINYGGVFGIENASQYYFGKSASDLNLAESSMLAGIPQSPSYNSPFKNSENAKNRQYIVLLSMKNNDIITQDEMNEAYNISLAYKNVDEEKNIKSLMYYRDAVIEELKTLSQIPESLIETGGLRIYTTLDILAQENLENSFNEYLGESDTELEASGIMVDPNNGGVLALIGGKDYSVSQYNRAINSKRQVGSTMKPFLYYSALESGFTASSTFTSELTTFSFASNKTYSPKNYNDTYANGPITMGTAISYSDNIYAVKTHLFLGEETLVNMANRVGITSKLQPVPSLALGTEEISLIDMVSAYSSFANLGYKVNGHFINRIEDSKGNILYKYDYEEESILNASLAFILNEMLTYTYDTSFIDYNYPTVISLLPQITNKYSIKTGTTDTDMWIIGYNKNAVLGIWAGYDDNRKINSNDGNYHKNIWINTMENYLNDKDNSWYEIPDNVVGVLVNPITGELADINSEKSKLFYYLKGTEPTYTFSNKDLESVFAQDNINTEYENIETDNINDNTIETDNTEN